MATPLPSQVDFDLASDEDSFRTAQRHSNQPVFPLLVGAYSQGNQLSQDNPIQSSFQDSLKSLENASIEVGRFGPHRLTHINSRGIRALPKYSRHNIYLETFSPEHA